MTTISLTKQQIAMLQKSAEPKISQAQLNNIIADVDSQMAALMNIKKSVLALTAAKRKVGKDPERVLAAAKGWKTRRANMRKGKSNIIRFK